MTTSGAGSGQDPTPIASRRASWLPNFSMKRPVTTLMIFFSFLLLGAVGVRIIPLQLLPDGFNPPFMWIWLPYPNSSPTEVEEKIVIPLEESLRTLKDLDGLWSTAMTDAAVVRMRFNSNTDMGLAYGEARDRLERTKASLPDDVREIYLQRANPNDEPFYIVGVHFHRHVGDPYYYLQNVIGQKFLRLQGVAKVEAAGTNEKIIQVNLNMARVQAHNVNLYELTQRLMRDNFSLSSGHVIDGGRRFTVRSIGRYTSIEEIADLPLRADGLRLSDIAEVTYGVPEITRHYRIDGEKAYALLIYKEAAANLVEVSDRVTRELKSIEDSLPGVTLKLLDEDGHYVTESLELLLHNGMMGGTMAAFLLFFFLRRARMTLLITLAIPLALLITVVVMYFAGQSMNIISMMGLMLSVGMLVDNSVVVVENIARTRRLPGLRNGRGTILGASEVTLAISMSTLTTIVVFLPSVLLTENGMMRFFMAQLAIPICISLLASLLVSLLFIPLWSSIIMGKEDKPGRFTAWMDRVYEKTLGWANAWYVAFLDRLLLKRRAAMAVLALIALVTIQVPFQRVHLSEEDDAHGRTVWIGYDFPGSYTLEDSNAFMEKVEAKLEDVKDKYDIRMYRVWVRKTMANVRIYLKGLEESDLEVPWVTEHLEKELPRAPGVKQFTNWMESLGSNETSMQLYLMGDDTEKLLAVSDEAIRRLKQVKGVLSVDTDLGEGSDEIRLGLDRAAVQHYGISPQVVSSMVAYAVRGYPLPRYRVGGKEIEVRIQVRKEDRENVDQVKNLAIPSASGGTVPLGSVATFQVRRALQEITRVNSRTALTLKISATLESRKLLEERVNAVLDTMQFPPGVSTQMGNLLRGPDDTGSDFQAGLLLSVCFVFLLMGVLFESFMLPFVVITSIPLAFFGSWWLLFITGTELNIMAIIGTILLAGVVVNNAIVLVDRINQLRQEGMQREDAIREAARQRFRPILMTALTTILGLLPMAFGKAAFVGMPYAPMGLTFVGGLTAGTFLTLLVVPLFYTYFDDWRTGLKRLTGRVAASWGPKAQVGRLRRDE